MSNDGKGLVALGAPDTGGGVGVIADHLMADDSAFENNRPEALDAAKRIVRALHDEGFVIQPGSVAGLRAAMMEAFVLETGFAIEQGYTFADRALVRMVYGS